MERRGVSVGIIRQVGGSRPLPIVSCNMPWANRPNRQDLWGKERVPPVQCLGTGSRRVRSAASNASNDTYLESNA